MFKILFGKDSLLSKKRKVQFVLVALGLSVSTLLDVIGVGIVVPYIYLISNPQTIDTNQTVNTVYKLIGSPGHQSFIVIAGIGMIVVFFLTFVLRILGTQVSLRYSKRIQIDLSDRQLRNVLELKYFYFQQMDQKNLTNALRIEINQAVTGIFVPALEILVKSLVSVVSVVTLFFLYPEISTILFLVLTSGYGLIYLLQKGKNYQIGKRRLNVNREQGRLIKDLVESMKETKIYSATKVIEKEMHSNLRELAKIDYEKKFRGVIPRASMEVVIFTLLIGYVLTLVGSPKLGDLLPSIGVVLLVFYRVSPILQLVFQNLAKLRHSQAGYESLVRSVSFMESVERREDIKRIDALEFKFELELRNVSFQYREDLPIVIDNVSLKITKGQSVAFIGQSGSGKTTLADIISGLYPLHEGEILVDGKVLMDNSKLWRGGLVAYVPQSPRLVEKSIAENIAFGIEKKKINYEKLLQSARLAKIDQYIMSLPESFESVILNGGSLLSGGQRQRIAIARALYFGSEILILDEATSALDGATEAEVMESIQSLSGSVTTILIAHRLSTVKNCDVVFYIEKGKILNKGTLAGLLDTDERVRKLQGGS